MLFFKHTPRLPSFGELPATQPPRQEGPKTIRRPILNPEARALLNLKRSLRSQFIAKGDPATKQSLSVSQTDFVGCLPKTTGKPRHPCKRRWPWQQQRLFGLLVNERNKGAVALPIARTGTHTAYARKQMVTKRTHLLSICSPPSPPSNWRKTATERKSQTFRHTPY